MRQWLVIALASMSLAAATPTRPAIAAGDAGAFIAETADSVLRLAKDQKVSEAEFKQRLRQIAEQDFDVPKIAQFVVGRYWRTASDAERQQFIQAFQDYMVQVYASRFRDYGGANFKVTGQRQEGNSTMVSTAIDRSNGQQPAKVIWQVANAPNGFKITDVNIEGVSQAVTYRQEFGSVIEQNGGKLSALTQTLRQKANG